MERFEKLSAHAGGGKKWYFATIGSAGVALILSMRLVTDKQKHEVRSQHPAPPAVGVLCRRFSSRLP